MYDPQRNVLATYINNGRFDYDKNYIYGTSRIGSYSTVSSQTTNGVITRTRGKRNFELSNHLGNVLAVVSDRKVPKGNGAFQALVDYFEPDVLSAQDYYPFGQIMPKRYGKLVGSGSNFTFTVEQEGSYRYGFNGKENDNEVKGYGNQQDYGMRVYDTRLARFLSVVPIASHYPELTPYQFASNSPIQAIDLDGLEGYKIVDHIARTTTMVADFYYVPKNSTNKTYNNGFTEAQAEGIKAGILMEFNKSKFIDKDHSDPITGENYSVNLQINLHPVESKLALYSIVNPEATDPLSSKMILQKQEIKTKDLPGGKTGIEKGGSLRGLLSVVGPKDSHNAAHELFHNFIHNHYNASEANKKQIDPNDQQPGHTEAGGIFIYEDKTTGIKQENLNQKNVDNALQTLKTKE